MYKSFLSLVLMLIMSLAACSDPCDSVAKLTCKAAGRTSMECMEMRDFAREANSQDQEVCKHVLETAKQLKPRQ